MRSLKSSIGNLQSSMLSLLLAAGMLAALAPRAEAVLATGGTVTNYTDAGGTNWTAHIFTNTAAATSIVFSVGGNVDVLVVGGGGAGRGNGVGGNTGDGGSAGQLVYIENYSVAASSYPIIVGLGGTGVVSAIGNSGSNSLFGFLSANGSYIQALGGAGGIGISSGGSAGGSGAGGAAVGKNGGPGLTNYISGSYVAYAGGGGGGNGGLGGVGGGGRGETYGSGNATAGTNGLGGGGGGVSSSGNNAGKNGGSGIVIVRYTTPSVSVTPINDFFVNGTTPISATATVYGDSPPFTVKFYTNSASGSYAQAGTDQGPATGPSFSVAMTGFADNSTNHIYAVVVDSAGKTNTSTVNTFFMVPNNQPISPYKAFCVGDVRSIFTNNVGTSSQTVYAVHKYTNTANFGYFVPSTSLKNVEVLLVGGGGGGGYYVAGGGGGGGVVYASSTVTAQSYPVVVGNGGAGGTLGTGAGYRGSDSTFNFCFAFGDGGGGGRAGGSTNVIPTYGGSGGGGGGNTLQAGAAGIYIGQGNAGGSGTGLSTYNGGGGGGAGAIGGNGITNSIGKKGGDGGNGITNSISGIAVVYAGGGGGGAYGGGGSTKGLGGSGGGGDGATDSSGGISGTNGLGGGGGGGGYSSGNGGAGGSGIVIIRYDISPPKGTVFMMR